MLNFYEDFLNENILDGWSVMYSKMPFDKKISYVKTELNKLNSKHKLLLDLKKDCFKFISELKEYGIRKYKHESKRKQGEDYYDEGSWELHDMNNKYRKKYENYTQNLKTHKDLTSSDKTQIKRGLFLLNRLHATYP